MDDVPALIAPIEFDATLLVENHPRSRAAFLYGNVNNRHANRRLQCGYPNIDCNVDRRSFCRGGAGFLRGGRFL
jgi:hypothetical protein